MQKKKHSSVVSYLFTGVVITGLLFYSGPALRPGYAETNSTGSHTGSKLEAASNDHETIQYYISKLADKDFITTYGHGYTWYTAAEELGNIGKPAIPYLIEKIDTKDDYERAVTFYALLLASQHENVKVFTQGEYISIPLEFDATKHPQFRATVDAWWEKYKCNW